MSAIVHQFEGNYRSLRISNRSSAKAHRPFLPIPIHQSDFEGISLSVKVRANRKINVL
jgi:hypothetical protein